MKPFETNRRNRAKFLRQRKFFLFLPVLVLPSVTVLFYLLGGGSNAVKAEETRNNKGLNTSLPDANMKKEKSWNKLQYYQQAEQDSARRNESIKNENGYIFSNTPVKQGENKIDSTGKPPVISPSTTLPAGRSDPDEEAVMAKLAQIDKAGNAPSNIMKELPEEKHTMPLPKTSPDEIKRLEDLMNMAGSKDDSDEEMVQLNHMLDKIMEVQHPERVKEKIQQESVKNKQVVYPLSTNVEETGVTLLQSPRFDSSTSAYRITDSNTHVRLVNAFYSLDEPDITPESNNAVLAFIDETKTVTNGATVKLRLGRDVYLGGLFVPKNTFVYGEAQLQGERLHITISSICAYNSILPVALIVYDLDGLEGIYIPGAIAEEVIKTSADQAVAGLGINTLDPSLKAQATNAGIEAAKSLLSKKTRLIKVTLKAGYQLLLKATGGR